MKKRTKKQPKQKLTLNELMIIQSAFNTYFEAIDFDITNHRDKALQAVIFNLQNRATVLTTKPVNNGYRFKLSPVEKQTILHLRNDLHVGLHHITDATITKLLTINQ